MPLNTNIAYYQRRVEQLLEDNLPDDLNELHQAMRYSLVLQGGKRLRPLLVYGAGRMLEIALEKLDNAAMAVECIHAYSLIHDDLPAMDNDDYRRGMLSCHKKFGEATAILAGDALQSFAFEILAENNNTAQIMLLARAIGPEGMALGQSRDMETKDQKISPRKLHQIHRLKTEKLITASVQLGLLCAQVDKDSALFETLTAFAENFGLAFQLRDDVRDNEHQYLPEQADHYFECAREKLASLSAYNITLLQKIENMIYAKN